MNEQQLVELIVREVQNALRKYGQKPEESNCSGRLMDPTQQEYKDSIQYRDPQNESALRIVRKATTARVGIDRCGCRLNTKSLISLRADHAMAKDAVLKSVNETVLKELHLDMLTSRCTEINEHLTRPDLGRRLSEEAVEYIKKNCVKNPQIQIYVSDGLSNSAVEENVKDLLLILMDGLKEKNVRIGMPFFVKYGRVGTMDEISELTGAEFTCVLLGERPGLAAADSLSAYITYGAYIGIPESKRTVISNIHKNGIQPVEAGAYLVDVLMKILDHKKSGVDLEM